MVLRVTEEKVVFKAQVAMKHSKFRRLMLLRHCIDDYVHDVVLDLLIKDQLINMWSEEEPPGEISQGKEWQEV